MKILYFVLRAFTFLLAFMLIIYPLGFIFFKGQLPVLIQKYHTELVLSSIVWLFVGITYFIPNRLTLVGVKYKVKMAALLVGFFWPILIFIFWSSIFIEIPSGEVIQYLFPCALIGLTGPLSLLLKKHIAEIS